MFTVQPVLVVVGQWKTTAKKQFCRFNISAVDTPIIVLFQSYIMAAMETHCGVVGCRCRGGDCYEEELSACPVPHASMVRLIGGASQAVSRPVSLCSSVLRSNSRILSY